MKRRTKLVKQLFVLVLLAPLGLSYGDPVRRSLTCQQSWSFNQAKLHLAWPFAMHDFSSHGEADDAMLLNDIESGRGAGVVMSLVNLMKLGESKDTELAFVGQEPVIGAVWHAAEKELQGEHLPYLHFLLIAKPEMETEVEAFILGTGASFTFVPYETQVCPAK